MDLTDLLYVAGTAALATGVALLTVWPWALVVVGVALLVAAVAGEAVSLRVDGEVADS